jgi:hypothetical protein
VVNNSGLVQARSIVSGKHGEIILAGAGGDVVNSGALDARGTQASPDGGDVRTISDRAVRLTSTSAINVAGATPAARGGSVHVSGHTVSVRGAMAIGRGGLFFLDPANLTVVRGSSGASASTVSSLNATVFENFIEDQLRSGADVHLTATDQITVNALNGSDLDGRGSQPLHGGGYGAGVGAGGDLLIGIGSSTSLTPGGAPGAVHYGTGAGSFHRTVGVSGGGIDVYGGNTIRVDGALSLLGGNSFGSVTAGNLVAGRSVDVQAADYVQVGDVTVNASGSTGSVNIEATNGFAQIGAVKVTGDVARAELEGRTGASIESIELIGVDGANGYAYTASGDLTIGESGITVDAVKITATAGPVLLTLDAGGVGGSDYGNLTVHGNIRASAASDYATVGLNANGNSNYGGMVRVNGLISVTGLGPDAMDTVGHHGAIASLVIVGEDGIDVEDAVAVSGYAGGGSHGTELGFGGGGLHAASFDPSPNSSGFAAYADLVSDFGNVHIGSSEQPAGISVTGNGARAHLGLAAGGGSEGASGNVSVFGDMTVRANDGDANLVVSAGSSGGSINVHGDVLVVGGGGTRTTSIDSSHAAPRVASATFDAPGGDIRLDAHVTVQALAVDWTDGEIGVSYGGHGGDALLRMQASNGDIGIGSEAGLGQIDVSAVGNAVVALGASDDVRVRGDTLVTATAARIDFGSHSEGGPFTGTSRFDGSAVMNVGNGSCGFFNCYSDASSARFGAVTLSGPNARLAVDAGQVGFTDQPGGNDILVEATGWRMINVNDDVETPRSNGGSAQLLLTGLGGSGTNEGSFIVENPGIEIDGNVKVTALAPNADAQATLLGMTSFDHAIDISGTIDVLDSGSVLSDAQLMLAGHSGSTAAGRIHVGGAVTVRSNHADVRVTVLAGSGATFDHDVTIEAGRDVELSLQGSSSSAIRVGGNFFVDADGSASNSSHPLLVRADGDITIMAGDSVRLSDPDLHSQQDIHISAGDDVSVFGSSSRSIRADRGIEINAGRDVHLSSSAGIDAAEDIHITAGRDINLSSSSASVVSDYGDVGFSAGGIAGMGGAHVAAPRGTVSVQGNNVILGSGSISGDTVILRAANNIVDYGSGSIHAGALGVEAGNSIVLDNTFLDVGYGAAPFGGDPLLGVLLGFGAPGTQPLSAAPNAAFSAPSITLAAGNIQLAGDHLYFRTDRLDLGSTGSYVQASTPPLVEYQPFTPNAPIHVVQDYINIDVDLNTISDRDEVPGLWLDAVHIFNRFTDTTQVFGNTTYFGDIAVGEDGNVVDGITGHVNPQNFIFITNGNVTGVPGLIETLGTVAVIQPFLLFNHNLTVDEYTPSQGDDEDKQYAEGVGDGDGDGTGDIEQKTNSGDNGGSCT